ncbi:hypothetical protein CRYUN_Cryun36dG0080800 [Craigia yunnanensis]
MLLRSSSTPVIGSLLFPFSDSPNKDLDTTYRLLHGLEDGQVGEEALDRTVTIGKSIDAMGNEDFSFRKKCMELIQEEERSNRIQSSYNEEEVELEPPSPPMYLATGLGIDGVGFGAMADVDLSSMDLDEGGDLEDFHKRLVDEYPCHPLFPRNCAKFLLSKGDLQGAEEYYHRATLEDPEDGEILLQYAKIVWDLHQDKDRALSYFERAVQASPQDCNVLGAYASFLWEIEDDAEEHGEQQEYLKVKEEKTLSVSKNSLPKEETEPTSLSLPPPNPAGFRINTDTQDVNAEDYYRRMVQENPCNPLVLSNYARFLHQFKGDLEGAEEYYSQAIQADPGDGETMSQYAKLVWDLHHDHDKASHYFERAVGATPGDSHVLAAYACFLWETEEDEDDNTRQDQTQVSLQHGVLSTINS